MAVALLLPVCAGAQTDDRKSAPDIGYKIAADSSRAADSSQDGESSQDGSRALTDAYNASGFALLHELSGKSGNIVLSPFSVGSAMAMALSGARGETAREMAGVLKQSLDLSTMEAANAAVLSGLRAYDKSALPPKCPPGMAPSGSRCEQAPSANGQCLGLARREGALCVAPGSTSPSARLLTANALMLTRRGDLVAGDYAALLRTNTAPRCSTMSASTTSTTGSSARPKASSSGFSTGSIPQARPSSSTRSISRRNGR
jgi:hypothetical protein